jgi:hypothetical protein
MGRLKGRFLLSAKSEGHRYHTDGYMRKSTNWRSFHILFLCTPYNSPFSFIVSDKRKQTLHVANSSALMPNPDTNAYTLIITLQQLFRGIAFTDDFGKAG